MSSAAARRACKGFTLVEVLVVVVIIGVIAAGALLAIGVTGGDRQLDTEGDRLLTLLQYAQEQAQLQTREVGLYCDARGFGFVAFDPRRELWSTIKEDEVLRDRELPEGLHLELQVEGRPVILKPTHEPPKEEEEDEPEPEEEDGRAENGSGAKRPALPGALGRASREPREPDPMTPHIMIFSNGDLTPFELTLGREDDEKRRVTLASNDQGQIEKRDPERRTP